MELHSARLVWITPDAEALIARIARVSNPANEDNASYARLLAYLINHAHWSPFEMASMCVEITTTRAIAAQILRHRSFSFQEFSQRYAEVDTGTIVPPRLRTQDHTNRQNSIDNIPDNENIEITRLIETHFFQASELYRRLIDAGVARECARSVLPLATPTRLYMSGTIRSWIHYVGLRGSAEHGAQLEHRQIAQCIGNIMSTNLPVIHSVVFEHVRRPPPIQERRIEEEAL